jgi:hypothetical protein
MVHEIVLFYVLFYANQMKFVWRRIKWRRKMTFILNVGCLVQFFEKDINGKGAKFLGSEV